MKGLSALYTFNGRSHIMHKESHYQIQLCLFLFFNYIAAEFLSKLISVVELRVGAKQGKGGGGVVD